MSKVMLFASGKGGVGKSTITANLAVHLARLGRSVVLVDADIGLRSLDLFLGLENRVVYDLLDAAHGRCMLSQALLSSDDLPSLRLLPAAQFARCKELDPRKLKKILARLKKENEFILIDCPAGMERWLRNVLNAGADETVLIVTPDDLCIRGAERVAALLEEKELPRPGIIVNRLDNDLIFAKEMVAARVVSDLLDRPLLGEIPEDPAVYMAQLRRRLVLDYACEAREALIRIARRLDGETVPLPEYGKKRRSFFRRHFPSPLKEVESDGQNR